MGGALSGRSALISGAGRGIGRHLALGLARAGMNVALLGRRPAGLDDTASECVRFGVEALTHPVDVRRPAAVRAVVDDVLGRLGAVDLLVNNAGIADHDESPPWQVDADRWWEVLETNLRGSFNLCRAVLPSMVAAGAGRIVNINSNVATKRDIRYTAYGTSKAALLALSDALAGPLRAHGVSIFDISPGMVRTDMSERMTACLERDQWVSVDLVVDAVVRTARGELDPVSGRYLHVGADDLTELVARARAGLPDGARTLRLLPYGAGDPLA
ncbi:SDR family NAD(P)-dependent oxidoreductase [Micromonospora sp. WMMD882]|uniref:SDR family NAD(P)-dependent oxidoreductase n=1 Tax=Micromonospora sp. WMMD882 TaxID=3015151 RepID=UPI00248AD341|nr:SDR family NAD(P)-dependent oxidoreductase [Micromonospora sp. WMMD882]WBB77303.1 SDR family NAD(P)-dependent oxidoreductase [Micromonospora sp. WMMD882]